MLWQLVVWTENRPCDRKWLLDNVSGVSGLLIIHPEQVNEELLEKAGSNLRVVSTMSVGYGKSLRFQRGRETDIRYRTRGPLRTRKTQYKTGIHTRRPQ